MIKNKNFGIIGGDLRQYYLAKSLLSDGNHVSVFGLDKIPKKMDNFKKLSLNDVIKISDYIIFPVPFTRDGKTLNAPFTENEININTQFLNLLKGKKSFMGIIVPYMNEYVKTGNTLIYDYYREDFIISNALLTAEGAIKIFFENSLKSISKCNCLVVGYGRIGKFLCEILKNLGANVTASARNLKDKSMIQSKNYNFINTNKLKNAKNLQSFDAIFNTVPQVIVSSDILKKLSKDVLLIDLASMPGGIDKQSAEKLNLKLIHKLGIPGEYFPKSAGEIIKNTIYEIIKEENI